MPTHQAPGKDAVVATQGQSAAPQDRRPAAAKIGPAGALGAVVQKREALGAEGVLALQAAAGNRAVAGLVQAHRERSSTEDSVRVHEAAERGIGGGSGKLPHLDRIQQSFGRHDMTGVVAHTGAQATAGAQAMGAAAFTMGNHVAFAGTADLRTAAHEAAHVVQQRAGVQLAGGVGQVGDRHERHADAVAEAVVQGRSTERMLDGYAGAAPAPAHPGQPIQRLLSLPGGLTAHRQGRIKMANLRDAIIAYNQAFQVRPANLVALIGLLDALESRVRRYNAEMTVAERDLHGDQLAEILREVYAERAGFERFAGQGTTVVRQGDVVTMEASEVPQLRRRVFDFSLARHWFPRLSSEAKPLNSILYHDLSWPDIEADCIEIGNAMKALWDSGHAEPQTRVFNVSSGRRYDMDAAGTSVVMNHFYVVNGTRVANVNQAAFIFFSTLSRRQRGEVDDRAVLGAYQFVENDWDTRFADIQAISGMNMAQFGAKTRAEKQHIDGLTTVFKRDILAYVTEHPPLDGLPTSLLQPQNWGQVGSALSYAEAEEAYGFLLRKHKLSFRDKKLHFND